MADPPFQMPGHRWDPEKKRFFKILPGQPAPSATGSSRAGKSAASRSKDQKKGEETPAQAHLTTIPRLPAFNLPDPSPRKASSKPSSSFAQTIVDPVTLRQQGRTPLSAPQNRERARIEATYAHLALFRAQMPFVFPPSTIRSIATHADGQSLLLMSEMGQIWRCSPLRDLKQFLMRGDTGFPPEFAFMWKSSAALLQTLVRSARDRGETLIFALQRDGRNLTSDPAQDPLLPMPSTSTRFPATTYRDPDFRTVGILKQTVTSFAACEASLPCSGTRDQHEDIRDVAVLAVASGKAVQIFLIDQPPLAPSFKPHTLRCMPSESDVMATAFDLSGKILFCGTRSGLILAWHWHKSASGLLAPRHQVHVLLKGEGSVTNLQAVSYDELLIVRIDGQVQLVSSATGQVQRTYQGHVNAYDFQLGFALDAGLRLFALAGLDYRVRVWSLDSPHPLGTSAATLPCIYHPSRHEPRKRRANDDPLLVEHSVDTVESFRRDHPTREGKPAVQQGSTLSSFVFPMHARALHWHPRDSFEGIDTHEIHALHAASGMPEYKPPEQRWKDLCVGAGKWLYLFRWP